MRLRIHRMARYLPGALGVLAVGLQAAPQQSPSTEISRAARIEGHVVSLADGRALAGASVRLRRETEVLSAPDPNEAAYTTRTDNDGFYVFDRVDPGKYRIYADQPGYVRGFYGARSPSRPAPGIVLQLAPSQALKGLDIKLPTQGSIAGHVENQDREPVSDASVSALWITYGDGHRLLIPMAFTGTTADGEFTLRPLPPGRYLVRVDQKATPFVAGSTKKGQREVLQKVLRQTYYPGSEEAEAAAPLTVAPGTQLTGIDFCVRPGTMFRVQGKVVWGGVTPPERPLVLALTTTAFDVGVTRPYLATVHDDGTFRFEEVVAGTYYLEPARIVVDVSKQRGIGGSMMVEIRDRDLSDIEFRLLPAPGLTGRILPDETPSASAAASGDAPVLLAASAKRPRAVPERQGPLPPPPPGQASTPPPPGQAGSVPTPAQTPGSQSQPAQNGTPGPVSPSSNSSAIDTGGTAAVATPAIAAAQTAAPDAVLGDVAIRLEAVGRILVNEPQTVSSTDGTFSLSSVPLGRYRVTTTNLAEGTYVKSVRFSGRDITNSDLDLTSGIGGELDVVLAKDAGEVAGTVRDLNDDPLSAAVVSLWRTARGLPEGCLTAESGTGGTFRLKHLAPGEYRVVAWEEIDQGLAGSGNFCRMFSSDSTSVTIDEHGGAQSVNLKAVSSARIEEAVWKLPR